MSSIFDILGPIMVGPSSSHTAGAVRIGYTARQLFGEPVKKAEVYLHGSFAATGEGHGTDKAIIAGLLGMKPDDLRIPDSFTVAEENGMEFTIAKKEIRGAHPNTARVIMENGADKKMVMQAYSIGGGRIRVSVLDGIEVDFSGESNTLIVRNMDRPVFFASCHNLIHCLICHNYRPSSRFRDITSRISSFIFSSATTFSGMD